MNKISIITVNRNNAEGLERTIKSTIDQTYSNYEFIIIDGASTDNSVAIIEKYAQYITFWISEPDTGIYNGMNKGINKSSGDYCYFLNSADVFADVDVLTHIFEHTHYTAPFINGHQIDDYGSQQNRVRCLNRPLTLYDFYKGTIKHQATFIHRSLFDRYGLYDENLRIISDWKFFLQAIGLHNEQPRFVDVDIVLFEWNGMSTNPQLEERHHQERAKVLAECIPQSLLSDYVHLSELNNYNIFVSAMKSSSLFDKSVRALYKLCKIFKVI
ncbi:MAG: hypothetical protein RL662_2284 [Bacteroidota bacterium]|jgi:glycosyltransferase involved in cell wall biosynthesis